MKITALGHSCVLLEFDGADEPTRILVDPWLSDHAVGDGMGRFPRVRFDVEALAPIHAVYVTHGHSDHLDPYTLVRLWRELDEPPVLLLPITLAFLEPLLREHLEAEVAVLPPDVPVDFRGLELLGFYDPAPVPTNEEDVMILVVTDGDERVLIEADANLSLEIPEVREAVSALLREPGLQSAVFLTTENELTGTLESKSCRSLQEREALVELAMNELLESVMNLYEPSDDPDDLWYGENVLRLIHGQGLTAPHELDPRWQHVLFPVRTAHRVREERATAERNGLCHGIDALVVGSVHTLVAGRVVATEPLAGFQLLDDEAARTYEPALAFFPVPPLAPIDASPRETERQQARIQALLDERFLPWLHGSRTPPVLHLLAMSGGAYVVRVHFGDQPDVDAVDYVLGFDARGFVAAPADGEPHEAYFANDLEDFLDGRCDEFSTFCRSTFPGTEARLWACLAMPLLNADLMQARMALHFERASQGLSPGSYVLPRYGR